MMKIHSVATTLGLTSYAALLIAFTNGCSCFDSCETNIQEVPAVQKTEQQKQPSITEPQTQKTPEKTPEVPIKESTETKKEPVPATTEVKITTIAPAISTVWTLELNSLKGAQKSWTEPAKNITLIYNPEQKQIAGCAGVNRYFGPTAIDEKKGTFKAGALGVTKMAGPGMEYEDLFLKVLSKVNSYKIEDGKLLLKSGSETVAVFTTGVKETK